MYNNIMKKFLLSLFVVFLGLSFTIGGSILLAGCGGSSQQQTEESGESETGESETGDGDEEISSDAYNVTIRTLLRYSSTSSDYDTTSVDFASPADLAFRVTLYSSSGSTTTFVVAPTVTDGVSVSGSSSSVTADYFNYVYSGSSARYMRITPVDYNEGTNYVFCGVTTSTSNSVCKTEVSTSTSYYIYGSGNVTTSSTTARNNCTSTLSGTFYFYLRDSREVTFHVDGYEYATEAALAGA